MPALVCREGYNLTIGVIHDPNGIDLKEIDDTAVGTIAAAEEENFFKIILNGDKYGFSTADMRIRFRGKEAGVAALGRTTLLHVFKKRIRELNSEVKVAGAKTVGGNTCEKSI